MKKHGKTCFQLYKAVFFVKSKRSPAVQPQTYTQLTQVNTSFFTFSQNRKMGFETLTRTILTHLLDHKLHQGLLYRLYR